MSKRASESLSLSLARSLARSLACSVKADARRCWDVFYHVNKTNFFKDRHYLQREWPELSDRREGGVAVLDLGCGVGNTTLPLLQLNPTLQV